MSESQSLKINEEATLHLLSPEESQKLSLAYSEILKEIETIIVSGKLDDSKLWFPSADFKWLIKQGE